MAINRLDRDTILNRALDLADSAVLDAKDRPSSPTIDPDALSITWLQEALDLFNKKFPLAQNIVESPITLAKDAITVAVPSDFILDYQDGIVLDDDEGRLSRRSLSFLLSLSKGTTASPNKDTPVYYAVAQNLIHFRPRADKAYDGDLWYYQLPAVLTGAQVPAFPDDYILVHYVWIKAQEWHRVVPIGSALQYANDRIVELQRAGIGSEAEPDVIPLDRRVFGDRIIEDKFVKVTTTG